MSPFVRARVKNSLPAGAKSDYGLEEGAWFREMVDSVVASLKKNAPSQTGFLQRNIRAYKTRGKLVARIEFAAPYTYFVNEKKAWARGKPYPHHHFIDKTLDKELPKETARTLNKHLSRI